MLKAYNFQYSIQRRLLVMATCIEEVFTTSKYLESIRTLCFMMYSLEMVKQRITLTNKLASLSIIPEITGKFSFWEISMRISKSSEKIVYILLTLYRQLLIRTRNLTEARQEEHDKSVQIARSTLCVTENSIAGILFVIFS